LKKEEKNKKDVKAKEETPKGDTEKA